MAMVMYLVTCGFVCDNSNVYSTCNIHTDSKCITYNNAFTLKHDIVINVHESHYSASASSFINHSLNPAQRLFCGGTQRNTARRKDVANLLHAHPVYKRLIASLKIDIGEMLNSS